MAHVVFLRGVNAGGHNILRPAQLARALSFLDVVNIGAAGTFIVRARTTSGAITREIAKRLPFECEIIVRPAREIRSIVDSAPFAGVSFRRDLRGWVGVLTRKPTRAMDTPHFVPSRREWALRVDRVDGRYAFGMWQPARFVIPANELEKVLRIPATVRWYETYERIARALERTTLEK